MIRSTFSFGLLLLGMGGWTAPAAAQTTFRGAVLYEKIPAGRGGLDLANPVRTPAAGVKVEVVAAQDRAVLGSGFTDDKGAYSIRVRLNREGLGDVAGGRVRTAGGRDR